MTISNADAQTMKDLQVSQDILLNNLRLMAEKNADQRLPLTARFMVEAADEIERQQKIIDLALEHLGIDASPENFNEFRERLARILHGIQNG